MVGRVVASGVCTMLKGLCGIDIRRAEHYVMAFSDFLAVFSGVSLPHVEMALKQKSCHEVGFCRGGRNNHERQPDFMVDKVFDIFWRKLLMTTM